MNKAIISLAVLSSLFVSCDNESNVNIEKQVEVPDTYVFTRGGESTVSYVGQTTRLEMTASLMEKLNTENVSSSSLLTMFNEGTGFSDAALNSSGKKIRKQNGCIWRCICSNQKLKDF